ncbi:MAG TPA: PEP-CTERM sorting domain-containing protein [Gemmatimonadales bacterium]|nr:PEP-CTERM sorting domain-containing protein [Gemmatimonadales bacterium]
MRFIKGSTLVALGAALALTATPAPTVAAQTIDVGTYSGSGCCGGTFLGTRGFWFVAPVAFQITGLSLPSNGTNGSLEVLRFNSPPPTYSNTTNDFTSLFYSAFTSASVSINVSAGDMIGILGYDGDNAFTPYSNSNGPYASSIFGNATTLNRLGFQSLGTAHDVWTEAPGTLGFINVDYDVAGSTVPEPATMTLLATGLVAMGAARRRKKNAA